jgi:hypothetical protein
MCCVEMLKDITRYEQNIILVKWNIESNTFLTKEDATKAHFKQGPRSRVQRNQ